MLTPRLRCTLLVEFTPALTLACATGVRAFTEVPASIANAGVLGHPLTGRKVVGLVFGGDARKLRYLRNQRRATVTLRAGWQWAAAEGPLE